MEDEKLVAYYDELTRKGGCAARFKQGLGFSSSSNDAVPARGSALPSATPSSFLSSFVRSSSPSKTEQFDKQAQLQSIQNKLTKKPQPKTQISTQDSSRSRSPSRNSIRKRSQSRDRYSRRRRSKSRSRSRSRDRYSKHRRRSRSREMQSRHNYRSRSRSKEKNDERRKRGGSPEERRLEKGRKRNGSGTNFAKLIEGYDHMTPAERVKAKMKFQLSKTAENDETIGQGSGWERFDFDKDAPLDDEEIQAVEDDAALVKLIGQSFRFSAVEARKEEQIKAAHDEAMFGASSHPPPTELDNEAEAENDKKQNTEVAPLTNLLSDQVLTMQQGSWRDRARKA